MSLGTFSRSRRNRGQISCRNRHSIGIQKAASVLVLVVQTAVLVVIAVIVQTAVAVISVKAVLVLCTMCHRRVVQHSVKEKNSLKGAPGGEVKGRHSLEVRGLAAPPQLTEFLNRSDQSAPC